MAYAGPVGSLLLMCVNTAVLRLHTWGGWRSGTAVVFVASRLGHGQHSRQQYGRRNAVFVIKGCRRGRQLVVWLVLA